MKQIILAALALTSPLFGQVPDHKPVPNPIADFSPEALTKDGFTALIKGNTLDGWSIKGSKANFTVEKGEVIGSATNLKGNSFLCTEKTYGDFIYTFQFKFDNLKGNSGCMFRGLVNEKGRVNGYQCEGDNTPRAWTAGLYDEARRGWLFPKKSNEEHMAQFTKQGLKVTKMDDWNQITIKCVGNHLQTWLNGEQRIDFKDTDPKNFTPEGFFGLQVHGGPKCDVRWRNIYVKELK
ncbi:MAG: 3-keto-disaccharide hydrolase [Verrucomicrobiaceae bacterium]